MSGGLLVAGTTSDAGKSVVTAGICRWLVRQGVAVAPFKAQNMSNNSMVTPDGAEIGRAQVMQAAAARVAPEAAMNPVLLKPGGENSSQVVVLGRPVADVTALSYRPMKAGLLETVLDCLADLRRPALGAGPRARRRGLPRRGRRGAAGRPAPRRGGAARLGGAAAPAVELHRPRRARRRAGSAGPLRHPPGRAGRRRPRRPS